MQHVTSNECRAVLDARRARSASGTRRVGSSPRQQRVGSSPRKQRVRSMLDPHRAWSVFGTRPPHRQLIAQKCAEAVLDARRARSASGTRGATAAHPVNNA